MNHENGSPFRSSLKIACCVLVALMAIAAAPAGAQAYPVKPIRFIVPYPPGGSTDVAGRIVAQELGDVLGQQVVVENRSGAGGNIGVGAVAQATPDGYTIGLSGMGPSVLTHIGGPKPPFTPKDFTIIGHAGLVEMLIVSNVSSPYVSTREIIGAAKANPGKIQYATGTSNSPGYLSFELFKAMGGITMAPIIYKGDNQALADLIGGQVPVGSLSVAGAIGQVKAGKLRAVAVYSPQRSPSLPDVPTVAESGLAGFEAGTFNILVGPAGLPAPIVQRLNSVLNEAMKKSVVRDRYLAMGMVPVVHSPQQASDFVARELAKWTKVVKDADIRFE